MATPSSSSSSSVRSWRTAFLTLRDESTSSSTSISQLLYNTIFPHSDSLIAAARYLPPPEVSSDLLFLLELATSAADSAQDIALTFADTIHLIHGISYQVSLEFSSSSWNPLLRYFGDVTQILLGKLNFPENYALIRPVLESLEIVRHVVSIQQRKFLPAEDIQLSKFLLSVIAGSQSAIFPSSNSIIGHGCTAEVKSVPKCNSLWDVQAVAFDLLSQAITSLGSYFPVDVWKSTIQVIRKLMDFLASTNVLVEDKMMSRYYLSLLRCLHLVIAEPKCSLSDHVSAFVAALRMFFAYGFSNRPLLACSVGNQGKEPSLTSTKSSLEDPKKENYSPYRPPHMRRRENLTKKQASVQNPQSSMAVEYLNCDSISSDSDHDSDGPGRDADIIQNGKVRVAAILCIQDLCQADPKAFTSQWTLLLPTRDVLLPRKFDATLMTCLLFDPSLKVQIASAAALVVMLDRTTSISLQIAEYRDPAKCVLYLIQRSTHGRLLTILFKILLHLISSTPYPRMPEELLLNMVKALQATIEEGFPFRSDQTDLLAAAIGCLNVALSTSQSSPYVKEMLSKQISTAQKGNSVLVLLLQYSEQLTNPTICIEALQALKAVSHNYPHIMFAFWEQVSSVVSNFLHEAAPEVSTGQWRVHSRNSVGIIGEKVITAAVKVLDECLRAISGFKGTEDLLDDNLLDSPFTLDCIRMKKVSSAPSYELKNLDETIDSPEDVCAGIKQWCEVIEKHLPRSLVHTSAMVRAASVTCFAGITSSVFSSLSKEKEDYILSSVVNAAVHDEVPSVRSAACRAIGVISCFPQVSQSAEILDKFIHAVEINTCDSLVSVRVTASWALANICESIRRFFEDSPSRQPTDSIERSHILTLLTESSLRLANDGDKIKSNAVRALGNLSRLIKFSCLLSPCERPRSNSGLYSVANNSEDLFSKDDSKVNLGCTSKNLSDKNSFYSSSFLERIVQAFISGITTGNVKVQWNVCHALSNLFLNETLRLQDIDRVSSLFNILLLLLRDSSNFKVRIQAAAALSVPASVYGYGKSFPDVVQGLEHTIENLESNHNLAPSFKYKVALEKQLISTMLHVLSLAASTDHQPLKDFLVKKATFLEEWFKTLCSSVGERSNWRGDSEDNSTNNQKREMILKALRSLIEVYTSSNQSAISQRFENLICSRRDAIPSDEINGK
ncbi:HEAT repeat-containing protein 6 isoform X1 [Cucumis melo var. makuwa]|uniref:HEAT repeat-containing protein 6 isoform X1 n=1 Tax=Cucumis melo var. makuwa TaxID=1194695 RepID=A0A5A7TH89_CUCMM|nr:HEAT repeat-containing protein 6 isoform X1 [Cucumis melo var. makuwa]